MPPGIASPEKVETRLGTLDFFDGFPVMATGVTPAMEEKLVGRVHVAYPRGERNLASIGRYPQSFVFAVLILDQAAWSKDAPLGVHSAEDFDRTAEASICTSTRLGGRARFSW
jgi:hypothetical protein